KLNPGLSAGSLVTLGMAQYFAGREAEALQTFEGAAARDKRAAFVNEMLALLYTKAGRSGEAATARETARAVDPLVNAANFAGQFRDPEQKARLLADFRASGF